MSLHPILAIFLVAALCVATGSQAQPLYDPLHQTLAPQELLIDLDGDGRTDRLRAAPLDQQSQTLTAEIAGTNGFELRETLIIPANYADTDTLEILPNGSLKVSWGCFACGRSHLLQAATLRWSEPGLQVIGYDYEYVDRIFGAALSCSVNLLTGRALIEAHGVERQERTADLRALPAQDFDWEQGPPICAALERYDDSFLEQHYPRSDQPITRE